MAETTPPTVVDAEQAIRAIAAKPPEQALVELTAVANRAVIELHKIARAQATQQRGQPDWGKWARLANAVRSGVLQMAAIRDSIKGLPPTASGSTAPPADTERAEPSEPS
jgi:hypothetical protein